MSAKSPTTAPLLDPSVLFDTAARQIDCWCDTQLAMLDLWQSAVDDWVTHRRQGPAAMHRTMSDIGNGQDVGDIAALQQQWLGGAVERMAADARTMAEASASCWSVARIAEPGTTPSAAARRSRAPEERRVTAEPTS